MSFGALWCGLPITMSRCRDNRGPSGGMVDAGDSKSPAFAGVPVRVRPWVPASCSSFPVVWKLSDSGCPRRSAVALSDRIRRVKPPLRRISEKRFVKIGRLRIDPATVPTRNYDRFRSGNMNSVRNVATVWLPGLWRLFPILKPAIPARLGQKSAEALILHGLTRIFATQLTGDLCLTAPPAVAYCSRPDAFGVRLPLQC